MICQARYFKDYINTTESQRKYFQKQQDQIIKTQNILTDIQKQNQTKHQTITDVKITPKYLSFKTYRKNFRRSKKTISNLFNERQKQNKYKSNQILTFSTDRTLECSRKDCFNFGSSIKKYNKFIKNNEQPYYEYQSNQNLSQTHNNILLSNQNLVKPLVRRAVSISDRCHNNYAIRKASDQLLCFDSKSKIFDKMQFDTLRTIQSKNHIRNFSNLFISSQNIEQSLSKRNLINIDFQNIRMVGQSLINESITVQNNKTKSITNLKHSIFNCINDLKQSQIIIQHLQPNINLKQIQTQKMMQRKQQSSTNYLRKMSSKLVQSIQLQNESQKSLIISNQTLQRTNLDRFIRKRESLTHTNTFNTGCTNIKIQQH